MEGESLVHSDASNIAIRSVCFNAITRQILFDVITVAWAATHVFAAQVLTLHPDVFWFSTLNLRTEADLQSYCEQGES